MESRDDKEFFIHMWQQNHMHNNVCCTPILAVIIVGILIFFGSCSTKKSIVEDEHVKTEIRKDSMDTKTFKEDSVSTFHKTDKSEKETVNTDTKIEKSDSTVMTVDTNGNVIKQETWHKEKETMSRNREYEKCLKDSINQFKSERDSLLRYVAMCDSLKEKLSHKEFITVEKQKIPKWCYGSLAVCLLFIIFAIIKFGRKLW